MGAGSGETSAVAIGGFTDSTTSTVATEEYGGSSWTAGGNMNTQRGRGAGFGIETAALVVGGNTSPDTAVTANSEEYNGSSWTESGDIFTATGTFIGAPASLGFIANNYGINNIFVPMLIIFIILIFPISFYRKKFSI